MCKSISWNKLSTFNTAIAPILNQHTHQRLQFNFPHILPTIEIEENLPYMNESFIQRGASLNNVTTVEYQPGKIIYYPKGNNILGISFEFSGCAMVQFKYDNTYYIAHISLPEACHNWNVFINNIRNNTKEYKDFILFKPYSFPVKDYYESEVVRTFPTNDHNISICGIIENENCYAGIMRMTDCKLQYCVRIHDVKRIDGVLNQSNYNNIIL